MVTYNFEKLKSTEHMFHWLADRPYDSIVEFMETMLNQQVEGTKIISVVASSEPEWLTSVIPTDDTHQQGVLTRAACAFEFNSVVKTPAKTNTLVGVFTWAANNIDEPEKMDQRTWLDLNKTLGICGGKGSLKERIYFD